MVFGGHSNDGVVIHPIIFSHDHWINMEAYIKFLEKVVLVWIKRVAAGKPYVFSMPQKEC